MGDAEVGSTLPSSAPDEENSGIEDQKLGDVEKTGTPNDGSADNRNTAPPSDDVAAGEDVTGDQHMADGDGTGRDESGTAQASAENGLEEGVPGSGEGKRGASSSEAAECIRDDDLYCSVRGSALAAINAVRCSS